MQNMFSAVPLEQNQQGGKLAILLSPPLSRLLLQQWHIVVA